MVGGDVSGSSRRCAECARKRKKCDLTEPACLRCVRSGIKCSGPNQSTLFIHQQQDSFPLQTSRRALQHAYGTRSTSTDRPRRFYRLSLSRLQNLRSAWIYAQLKSSLPGDEALLSHRFALIEPLYTSLLEEFQPDKPAHPGIFSADRAPTVESRHYSSIAICIRSLLPWAGQRVPVLDPSIFSLLTLYYGRLHGDSGLIDMARSSYTTALHQYHRHIEALSSSAGPSDDGSMEPWVRASIALQFFEHLDKVDVFDAGHQAHIDGALKMLHSCGPKSLETSQDFRMAVSSLKPIATFLAIFRREPNFLSDPAWDEQLADNNERSAREQLFEIGLGIPRLLNTADNLVSEMRQGHPSPNEFVDLGLHLLLEFERMATCLEHWLIKLKDANSGPLYWPRSQPLTAASDVNTDTECGPKQRDGLHQLSFMYGTIAGLLVQYWAFQLELLMTTIDLRQAILSNSESVYVRNMSFASLSEDRASANEISQLMCEAQVYLDSCLEGFICMQLPLKTLVKYFERPDL